jgi:hypothetical protein
VVSSEPESMASDEAPKVSAQHLETSTQQDEKSLIDQLKETSMETGSPHGFDSDRESRYGDSRDSEMASNNSGRLKVAASTALAGISYDFRPSKITKTHIGSMENYAHYFLKGYS